jgi:hypothetical protein
MGFLEWIGVIVAIALAGLAFVAWATRRERKRVAAALRALPDFTMTDGYAGDDGASGIAIDAGRRKIAFVQQEFGRPVTRFFEYRDILEVEILEDGASVVKSSRASQVARGLIGGLLMGGVGLVADVMSAPKTIEGKVGRIDLRVVVNDASQPVFNLNMLNVEVDRGGSVHQFASRNAAEWLGRLKAAMRMADADETAEAGLPAASIAASEVNEVADEIAKLAAACGRGAITVEEYSAQKTHLLGGAGKNQEPGGAD